MRNRLFRLILYTSVIQQLLFFTVRENIPEINFLYGVPLTHQISFHAKLFGYWYLPVFFILYYFSEYFSCTEHYEIMILIKHEKKVRYFVKKLLALTKELAILVGMQAFVGILADAIQMKFFDVRSGFFQGHAISDIMIFLANYYIAMMMIILMENTLEAFFENSHSNVIINIFVIASIVIYNDHSNLRQGIFRLANISMYARVHALEVKEYIYLFLILCCSAGILFCCWKRKNLWGGKQYD